MKTCSFINTIILNKLGDLESSTTYNNVLPVSKKTELYVATPKKTPLHGKVSKKKHLTLKSFEYFP